MCEFKFQIITRHIYSCIHKLYKLVLKKLLLNWLVITTQKQYNRQILHLCDKINTTQAKYAICYALGLSSQRFDRTGILKCLTAETQ